MTVDGNTLYFTYDASGTPQTVTYNGTTYYYATNLQGDITAILDSTGTTVVSYTYDAWGNHTSGNNGTGTLASTLGRHNPLRYRGYVYDTETGLYYLQSRYYNPATGRFISADVFAATGQGMLGNNVFVYCLNNPVNMYDPDGECSKFLGFLWKIDCKQESCPESKYYVNPTGVEPIGTYNREKNYVYIVTEDQLGAITEAIAPNDIVVVDKRKNVDDEKYNQNMQVRNSYRVTNSTHQREIIDLLLEYNKNNPVTPAWNRTADSMLTEWAAHNDGYSLSPLVKLFLDRDISENCRHVDFDNKDEPLGYWDYYSK